jgi:CHC2 zinc finger
MNISPQWKAWRGRALAASIQSIAFDRKLDPKRQGRELIGACPRCGGQDRFATNVEKGCFNCRGCNAKGDVIALVRFFGPTCQKLPPQEGSA